MSGDPPAPKFQRLERVRVVSEPYHYPELLGQSGMVLWRDYDWATKSLPGMSSAAGWLYLVFFVPENAYRSLWESELRSEGTYDQERTHLGSRPEFSLDIIMEDDMEWVEGTYRLPDQFWKVMMFGKKGVPEMRFEEGTTHSGVPGIWFDIPCQLKLNRDFIRNALTVAFGIAGWVEVQGPDSMILR